VVVVGCGEHRVIIAVAHARVVVVGHEGAQGSGWA
jgi:hypothetical protein